jgi:hypothetical protein
VYIGSSAGRNTTSVGNVFVGWSSGELNTNVPSTPFWATRLAKITQRAVITLRWTGSGFNSGDLDHATVIGAVSCRVEYTQYTLGRAMGEDLVRIRVT